MNGLLVDTTRIYSPLHAKKIIPITIYIVCNHDGTLSRSMHVGKLFGQNTTFGPLIQNSRSLAAIPFAI